MLTLENRKVSFPLPPSFSTMLHSLYSTSGPPFIQLMALQHSSVTKSQYLQGLAELPLDLVYTGTDSFSSSLGLPRLWRKITPLVDACVEERKEKRNWG